MTFAYCLARPLLFALDPETAHHLALRALASGIHPRPRRARPMLHRRLLGLDFVNPLGIAAGFDKNAEVPDALLASGFGFVEVGTVTPRPQPGNPRPRLFRLPDRGGLINRLGFNNDGHDAVHARLAARRDGCGGIVGVNLGANRDSPDRIADYVLGVRRFADVADFMTINISSPNTPGLRDLQEPRALESLLGRVAGARASQTRRVPLLLKIAPDLDDAALADIVEAAVRFGIDGLVVANTTVGRDGIADHPSASETGGLSGRPLFHRSTVLLAKARRLAGTRLMLVGVGGVDSPDAALAKIRAGADLVQLYTGFIFEGPALPGRIIAGMTDRLARDGHASLGEVVGADADGWASPSGRLGEGGHHPPTAPP